MIDFNNAAFIKLHPVDNSAYSAELASMLVPGEKMVGTFQGIRDGVIFTDRRVIAVNVQGVTGKKKDFTSLPYKRVQAFSVETSGVMDLDSELDLWFSGLGNVRFCFARNVDVYQLASIIGEHLL